MALSLSDPVRQWGILTEQVGGQDEPPAFAKDERWARCERGDWRKHLRQSGTRVAATSVENEQSANAFGGHHANGHDDHEASLAP